MRTREFERKGRDCVQRAPEQLCLFVGLPYPVDVRRRLSVLDIAKALSSKYRVARTSSATRVLRRNT